MHRDLGWFPIHTIENSEVKLRLGTREGVDYEALVRDVDDYQLGRPFQSSASWGGLALEVLHMRGLIEEMLDMIHVENAHQVDGELISPRRARDWMQDFCQALLNDKVDD